MCERCVGLSKGLSLLHHDLLMFRVMITLVLRLGGESRLGVGGRGALKLSRKVGLNCTTASTPCFSNTPTPGPYHWTYVVQFLMRHLLLCREHP